MANVQLSARLKKLAKDFAIVEGRLQMPPDKMVSWLKELDEVAQKQKRKIAQELIALALRFERESKEGAAIATAQLYVFASSILKYSPPAEQAAAAPALPTPPARPSAKPRAAPKAGKAAGRSWGSKSKR